MTVCNHTGIAIPECSCRACLEAQIERHMPSLLGGVAVVELPQTAEMQSVRRPRFFARLRGLRRFA